MGRRKGPSLNDLRLRQQLAEALWRYVGERHGGASAAATAAGISRQQMSNYLHQRATPTGETLRSLCAALQIRLVIEGATIEPTERNLQPAPITGRQASLFSAMSGLSDRHLTVEVLGKRASSMDLKVTISFDNNVA